MWLELQRLVNRRSSVFWIERLITSERSLVPALGLYGPVGLGGATAPTTSHQHTAHCQPPELRVLHNKVRSAHSRSVPPGRPRKLGRCIPLSLIQRPTNLRILQACPCFSFV